MPTPAQDRRTRDAARTRSAVLDAFSDLVIERGANVSLAEVAARAGVTKSGLMHHFPSRDELITQLVNRSLVKMWDEVRANVDLAESRPGQFTRAYVRTLTGGAPSVTEVYSPAGILSRLGHEPALANLEQLAPDDAERWNEAFARDGLPMDRVLVIRYAAEGVAASANTPYASPEQVRRVRNELLAMAEPRPDETR